MFMPCSYKYLLLVDMQATAGAGKQLRFVHPLLFTLYCTNISMYVDLNYLNTFLFFREEGMPILFLTTLNCLIMLYSKLQSHICRTLSCGLGLKDFIFFAA